MAKKKRTRVAKQHTQRYQQFLVAFRQARKDAGLTQREVARQLSNYNSYIAKSESGDRRVDVVELVDFCRVYGITVSDLLAAAGLEEGSPPSKRRDSR